MSLPRYDYLYTLDDYSGQSTEWIREQLEMAIEEGSKKHIDLAKRELAIRDIAHKYNYPIEKIIPTTGYYIKEERKTQSFWKWLKSFLPLHLW